MKRIVDNPRTGTILGGLALFVALGGTSYGLATGSIGSREIKDHSIRARDLSPRLGVLSDRVVVRYGARTPALAGAPQSIATCRKNERTLSGGVIGQPTRGDRLMLDEPYFRIGLSRPAGWLIQVEQAGASTYTAFALCSRSGLR